MFRSKTLTRRSASTLVLFALAATSCGKFVREERLKETGATLEGTVKYGGEDVQFAMIVVKSSTGAMTGMIREDGRYRVENVPLGDVQIGVNTAAAQGEYQSKMMAAGVNKGPGATGKGRVQGRSLYQHSKKLCRPRYVRAEDDNQVRNQYVRHRDPEVMQQQRPDHPVRPLLISD